MTIIPNPGYHPGKSDTLEKNGVLYYFDEVMEAWIPVRGLAVSKDKMTKDVGGTEALQQQGIDRTKKPGRDEIKAWIKWHKERGLDPVTGKPEMTRGQKKKIAREQFRRNREAEKIKKNLERKSVVQ